MVKIINSYSADDSLATAFQNFAGTFGQNTPQKELTRQKAYELSRQNTNVPLLADAITRGDYDAAARAGIMSGQEPKYTAGYGQYVNTNRYGPSSREATTAAMAVPGANYGHTMAGEREAQANRVNIENLRTQRLFDVERYKADTTPEKVLDESGVPVYARRSQSFGMPAFVPHNQTMAGTREAEDNRLAIEDRRTQRLFDAERYKADNTPANVLVDGVPTIVPKSVAVSDRMRPVLSHGDAQGAILQQDAANLTPEQRAAAGGYAPKDGSSLHNYVAPNGAKGVTTDGRTDRQSGVALPTGTQVFRVEGASVAEAGRFAPDKSDASKLRQKLMQNQNVVNLSDRILGIVESDPTVVGPTGNVRRLSQNAVDTLNNAGLIFGDEKKFASTITAAQSEALSRGVNPKLLPGLFDSKASNIVKMNTLLVYQTAAALAGQSGRDVSNADVEHIKNMVGNPAGWTEGTQQYLNGIRLIREMAAQNHETAKTVLQSGDVNAVAPPQPAAAPAVQKLKQKYGLE